MTMVDVVAAAFVLLVLWMVGLIVYQIRLRIKVEKEEAEQRAACVAFVDTVSTFLRERGFFKSTMPQEEMYRFEMAGCFVVWPEWYEFTVAEFERRGMRVTRLETPFPDEISQHNHKLQYANNYTCIYLQVPLAPL